jgi:hypothetical protein
MQKEGIMTSTDHNSLLTLAKHRGWPSISIYLPTHTSGAGPEEDRIRLRNLIKTARERLVAEGVRDPDASLLKPLAETAADELFWRSAWRGGLALFVSEGEFERVVVDVALPEQCVVGDRYYLRPLFAAVGSESRFYALAIGKAGSHLYACDAGSIVEVAMEDTPSSLEDSTKYDVAQADLQGTSFANSESIAGAGRATAMFHGHGGEKDVQTTQMRQYLHRIETAATKAVGAENDVPLILVGVEDQLALYREMNSYHHLVSEQVTGSIAELSVRQLHEKALAAVQPRFAALVDADLARLAETRATTLVLTDAAEIVAAAATGRVKTLFFDDSVGPFGHFDPLTLEATMVCSAEPRYLRESQSPANTPAEDCGWDLVDIAAAETIIRDGVVRAFGGEDSPVSGVAALLRY